MIDWTSLTSGLIGSVVGVMGAFGAATIAITHDRRQRGYAQARQRGDRDKEIRRRIAYGADKVRIALINEQRWWPIFGASPESRCSTC
jgi:hypothetical protein